MKNAVAKNPNHAADVLARGILWFFSENPLVFSGNLLNSSKEVNEIGRLFIGFKWVEGDNSLTSTLMAGFFEDTS